MKASSKDGQIASVFGLWIDTKKITRHRGVLSSTFPQQVGCLLRSSSSRSQSGQDTRVTSLLRSLKLVKHIHYYSGVTKTVCTQGPAPVNPTPGAACSWGPAPAIGGGINLCCVLNLGPEGALSTVRCMCPLPCYPSRSVRFPSCL